MDDMTTNLRVTLPPPGSVGTPEAVSRASQLNQTGANFFGAGNMDGARLHFLAALELEPNHPMALQNLGAVLRNMGHHAAAESVARRSVEAAPENAFCRSNLGVAQLSNRKFQEALGTLGNVLKMMPDSGPSHHNYGLLLYMMGRYSEALHHFNRGLELSAAQGVPENPHLVSDKSLTLLQLQRLQEGLASYEVRWKILAKSPVWNISAPEWRGEPIAGKRLLVHHEQGFGDSIMLIRFITRLTAMQAKITVAVPDDLVRLFEASFGDSATFVSFHEEARILGLEVDYHVPMLSVLRYIGLEKTSQIDPAPYLRAPKGQDLPNFMAGQYKIGIVWASGDHGPALMERRRLAPVVEFLPLTEIPNTVVVSLQKGPNGEELRYNGLEGIIYDAAPRLTDFAATAALILKMDVVVSVDSAVAHLAGALGVPCLVLSPYTRCWRWWENKTGMPWYRDMQLFFQKQNGSWSDAISNAIRAVRLLQMGIK